MCNNVMRKGHVYEQAATLFKNSGDDTFDGCFGEDHALDPCIVARFALLDKETEI